MTEIMTQRHPAPAEGRAPGFGIYVHWPFCRAKCPYCDFNSHVRANVDPMAYGRALVRELATLGERLPGRRVTSVFFGGGTPSLMPPETVAMVLDRIAELWPVEADAEITLEANPTSAEAANFRGYRSAGVNRASVGLQALHDDALRALGREHSAAEGLAAFRMAAGIFPRVSLDLIYARPHQTRADWAGELDRALCEAGDHLSLYQLTIEPGTPFAARHRRGTLVVPEDDEALALFEITRERTAAAGFPAYEISNHARPGGESRHNLLYWRYGEYLGVGPGAHGRLEEGGRRIATTMARTPDAWLSAVREHGHGLVEETELDAREQAEECLLMGMRLEEGLPLARLQAVSGLVPARAMLDALSAEGLLAVDGARGRIAATREGRLVLNALIAELAAALEPAEHPVRAQNAGP